MMLEFENQMLLDLLQEDGLLIAARGIGIENVLINLLRTYSDAGNLVLVIGTSQPEEQFIISELGNFDNILLPKCITTECSIGERSQLYLNGGCFFVTSRILVVDMLKGRIPVNLITGLIIWKAHKILESCQEAFILRLFRQKNKPEVIEIHLQMTQSMKQMQIFLLELITSTLQELKLSNRAINIDEFCTENAISRAFDKIIKLQLDPIWHQLSPRTKQLVADLKVLRTLLMYLTQYDCVTFYNLLNSLRTTEKVLQSAGWMLLGASDALFTESKKRVFGDTGGQPLIKKAKVNSDTAACDVDDNLKLEANPKWLALSEVLSEVTKESHNNDSPSRCLIVARDDRTCQQLTEILSDGARKVLLRIFRRTLGRSPGVVGGKGSINAQEDHSQNQKDSSLIHLAKRYDDSKQDNTSDSEITEIPKGSKLINNFLLLIRSLKDDDPYLVIKMLEDLKPKFIVMYDSDLSFIRHIEVWQAKNPDSLCKVYFFIYKGTVDEQAYLTNIKREKDAFEYLIKEKASMVLPEYTEGRSDDHPDLSRSIDEPEMNPNDLTRKGGLVEPEDRAPQRIIVDMREFRSELPSILHKRGIDIEPATIEVGDYVLTPDICVERKSLSDLIGSLNSGRLYNQAVAMTRHYKSPILLIEFDHNKPFHLQGRLFLSNDASSSSKDMSAKLQLLTLHFPRLRLLWCPSPYATAELFHMLKKGKEEPSVEQAQAVLVDSDAEFGLQRCNPLIEGFLSKLPGVTSKNISIIMRRIKDLPHLLQLTKPELTELLQNSKAAQDLYSALHSKVQDAPPPPPSGKYRMKTKFGKPLFRK